MVDDHIEIYFLYTVFMYMNAKYTKEQLEKIVRECGSFRQVLSKLGLKEAGGNYKNIKARIKIFHISTEHFHGMRWNKGKTFIIKKDVSKILCENSSYTTGLPYNSDKIRKLLFKHKLKEEKCEECNLIEWRNNKLSFELHHINGISNDNRIENLQILCPNCHSQTKNYRGRNVGKHGKDKNN
jgi:Zn finger protein HypA/HybF involved in hydrogenase expression